MNDKQHYDEAVSINRENWNQRTPIHLRSSLYTAKIERLKAGDGADLTPPTGDEIGDVAGKRVLHLQCHFGLDTFSLVRRGAEATGLDISPAALGAAHRLAKELDLDVRFVEGDAQRADEVLNGEQFDLVFASFGVFCWIPDVRRWLCSAATLLKPGGVLYVADFHPFLDLLDFDNSPDMPNSARFGLSYFETQPIHYPPGPTYADDGSGALVPDAVEYVYRLSDVVSYAIESGLKVEYLHEFPSLCYRHSPLMVKGDDGLWDFPPPLRGKLPMVFSLRAIKEE